MLVNFSSYFSSSFLYIRNQILQNTTPLQRKISAIVLCIIAGLSTIYLMIHCRKENIKNNIQKAKKQKIKQLQKLSIQNKENILEEKFNISNKEEIKDQKIQFSINNKDVNDVQIPEEQEIEPEKINQAQIPEELEPENANHVPILEEQEVENNQLLQLIEDKKYYFIEKFGKSYSLISLINQALKDLQSTKEKAEKEGKEIRHCQLKTPEEQEYSWIYLTEKQLNNKTHLIAAIIEKIQANFIVDWARTTHQTTCSISLENFDKPHILNMNGRTYSQKFITKAIEESLYKDEFVRLEDMTLQPSMIEKIALLPNFSLRDPSLWDHPPERITFSAHKIQIKDFNEQEALMKNINGFSEFIRDLPPLSGNMLDSGKLYNYYADTRNLPHFTNLNETIENLVIKNIQFFSHHPKCDAGHITFSNILFEKCQINMQCWCGISVKTSKFVDCIIDLKKIERPAVLRRSKLVNCTIIVNDLQPKGVYRDIKNIPNIVNYIHNIVENASDLENCTLESV